MKVKIITKGFHFSLPVPIGMAGIAVKMIPDKMFEEMRAGTPKPYDELVTKETINLIVKECMDILKENKGLEVVHVEASDGTFVSIKL
ncbi:hypothetical protein [Anaerofustis stercorihominis]|uniref:hypothetical protein n=1 Tax=Anaerofustis stercorihominis TaxID=214853 RepID=UPI00214BF03A|nr:hypothetical protein [Anaerofustis stercorihominis]MCR2033297.1 hypothetical protein [Anaerofustis stercorihominis]